MDGWKEREVHSVGLSEHSWGLPEPRLRAGYSAHASYCQDRFMAPGLSKRLSSPYPPIRAEEPMTSLVSTLG